MSTYTISPCLFQCDVQQWGPIVTSFVANPHLKIALDCHGRAMDRYKTAPIKENKELMISCLDLIAKCNKYEQIAIGDPAEDELFLDICANTVGSHEIIVRTKQAYPHLHFTGSNTIEHKGAHIVMYDKDEAPAHLCQQPSVHIGTVTDSTFSVTGDVNPQYKK